MAKDNVVQYMAGVLDAQLPLVGRPDGVEFGPFSFYQQSLFLLQAQGKQVINGIRDASGDGTVDKKLIALDGDRQYWLYLRGFSALVGWDQDQETTGTIAPLLAHQFIGMERNSSFTYEQLSYGVEPMSRSAGTGIALSTINPPDHPSFMFKHWWVLDGETDQIFQQTDFDTPMAGDVECIWWFYGFAIKKSIQAQIDMPECGPGALKAMSEQGAMSLSTVMALRSRA